MKKILIGAFVGLIIIAISMILGAVLFAQEQKPESTEVIILGGLKLNEGADPEAAEKLFKELLIPGMSGIEGLEMKVLKLTKMPNQQEKPNTYDYIMMAEMDNPMIVAKLMQNRDERLSKFGDMMKEYAGSPDFNMYSVIAETEDDSDE